MSPKPTYEELAERAKELEKQALKFKQAETYVKKLNRLREGLPSCNTINQKLKHITDGIVDIFQADFARIWRIKKGDLCDQDCLHADVTEGAYVCKNHDECLHLTASSGHYTRLNGSHRRVPFGCYKIGRVAAGNDPKFLINDVTNDPEVDDHQWARRHNLVSFAGYRLLSKEGKPIGVLALFSKNFITSYEDALFESIAISTAQVIQAKKVEISLRESEEKYRNLFENAQVGLGSSRISDGKILECNEKMANIFGYNTTAEFINDFVFSKQYVDPGIREKMKRKLEKHGVIRNMAVQLYRKEGDIVWIRFDVQAFPEKGYFEDVVVDITEQKKAEEEKKKLLVRLQQSHKMEAIGTLAGGVAHDLNNILSGIVSYPELILMDLAENHPLRKPILTIQKSGEKAAVIVQDLLTLARRGVAIAEVVNVNQIISELLKSPEFEKLISFNPKVRVETEFEKGLLCIKGSAAHLSKSVMNLISNSAEAMPEGGTILLSTENRYIDPPAKGSENLKTRDYVIISVSDNGVGISEEDLEKIFEPFYTKKTMGRSGTGLGMAVVWGTVKDHKGHIDLKSTIGEGTSITLSFPATREVAQSDISELPIEGYMGKGETILVVDDVEEQQEIATAMLTKLGYAVVSVSSGEEAVEYLKNNTADLLLLDMIMDPGIDGLETYKRILNLNPEQKAVIASGFSETERVKETIKLGACAYVKKPYLMEKIRVIVRGELDKQKR